MLPGKIFGNWNAGNVFPGILGHETQTFEG